MILATKHENTLLREHYFRFTHKSGLDVYVFPKKLSTTYAVFGTRYGSIDNCFRINGEGEYRSVPDGIAHYLEHRMFTQADGSDITERFSQCGADCNAYTTYTKTVYLFSCTDNAEEALSALVNFVTQPYFTDRLVERERGIIVQEIRMGEDDPYEQCYDRLMQAMYHNHSVRTSVAGSVESVSEITADMLNLCYRSFYNPTNMALVVCGDLTPEQVEAVVDRTVPSDFVAIDVDRRKVYEPEAVKNRVTERTMTVAKPIFAIGIKDNCLVADSKKRIERCAAMSILCDILFSRSGELYNAMFEADMVSPDFSGSYACSETFAFVSVTGESDDPMAVLSKIQSYISALAEQGVSNEALERSRRVLYSEFVKDFDSTEEIANNMIDFILDGADLLDYGNCIRGVTKEMVNGLLREAFRDEYFCISVIRPEGKENL